MVSKYYKLDEIIGLIEPSNGDSCRRILEENYKLFSKAPGSSHNHQAWEGGYLDHVTEVCNIAIALYEPLDSRRKLPFSLSDSLLVLFLHDLEKPWKHSAKDFCLINPITGLKDKNKIKDFVDAKIKEYSFQLTEEHRNAIKYAEGEGDDYSPKKRIQSPLAAFAHVCDNISARIWFDQPVYKNDPWK